MLVAIICTKSQNHGINVLVTSMSRLPSKCIRVVQHQTRLQFFSDNTSFSVLSQDSVWNQSNSQNRLFMTCPHRIKIPAESLWIKLQVRGQFAILCRFGAHSGTSVFNDRIGPIQRFILNVSVHYNERNMSLCCTLLKKQCKK